MKTIKYRNLSLQEQANLREAILSLRFGPTKDSRKP
jgi:hypothetical protein